MAIVVRNTNYSGEVLEKILTKATTGNEIVGKGLIFVIPGIEKAVSVPRLKTGGMLQKRKEMPTVEDSKGNFNYSEKKLTPVDFMAFTVFNPRTFEQIWRKWQPKGDLVFSELPSEGQNALLEEMSKQVQFELGNQYVNGEFGDDDDHLFNGIIHQMSTDGDVIIASTTETTMLGKLKALREKIPVTIAEDPKLRILMSVRDFNQYDDELTAREYKNSDETSVNRKMYKGIKIETLAAWPDSLLICTLCAPDATGNLFAAVNLQDDEHVIQIDKISNAGELYFFKMLMKADTNIAFGELAVALDTRTTPVFKSSDRSISVDSAALTFTAAGGAKSVKVTATGDYSHTAAPKGYKVTDTTDGVTVTADANTGTADVTGKLTFTLDSDSAKTVTVTLTTSKPA